MLLAYFATQNTSPIPLNFLNYSLTNIPAYVIIVGALLIGLSFAWLVSLINGIFTGMDIRGKDNKIKDYVKENAELTKKVHQLELENTRLNAKHDTPVDDKSL